MISTKKPKQSIKELRLIIQDLNDQNQKLIIKNAELSTKLYLHEQIASMCNEMLAPKWLESCLSLKRIKPNE